MIYKQFKGLKLSALGMGMMRLPVVDGDDAKIDEDAALGMVDCAYKSGINYFDTAWGYHDGMSETVAGKALARYPRDSFYLATKFPGYDLENMGKTEHIFSEQLKKCGTDYFDFYLVHNVCEMNIEQYLDDEKYGTLTYLLEQKRTGRIRHLGFSAHGKIEVMRRFLEKYGRDMEFCQIQLNYLDWSMQDARGKLELLREYGLPVWVMEPLRGGRLASLATDDVSALEKLRPGVKPLEWAFRYLQTIPENVVVLSGMSTMEQLKENIDIFNTEKPLDDRELGVLLGIADKMVQGKTLPCTACHYCVSHCPKHLDIPELLSLYNEHHFSDGGFLAPMALMAYPEDKRPEACLGCRSCEAVCPQQIKISDALADFAEQLKKTD